MNANPNDVSPTTEVTENGRDARSTQDAESNRRDACSTSETTITSPIPLSANKLAANRRNARKSTGPKTAEGKEESVGGPGAPAVAWQRDTYIAAGRATPPRPGGNGRPCAT